MAKTKPVKSLLGSFYATMALRMIRRASRQKIHHVTDAYAKNWCSNYKSRFMEVDGKEIHYQDEGEGPVLLLLHGFGASLHTWEPWIPVLREHYRILRLDLPGFGLSQPVRQNLDVSFFTGFVARFLEAMDVDRCSIAGNSLGGWIAWEFGLQHPEAVDRLVLLNPAGYFQPGSEKPRGVELMSGSEFRKLFKRGAPKMLVRQLVKNSFAVKGDFVGETVMRTYITVNRPGMLRSFIHVASSEARSNFDQIHQLEAPTLIFWGQKDKVIPVANARKFLAEIPDARLVLYEGVGHVPMLEHPESSVASCLAFLRGEELPEAMTQAAAAAQEEEENFREAASSAKKMIKIPGIPSISAAGQVISRFRSR